MWKNYLKIALRNLRRYRGQTVINVAGLAVGIACCLLIFLFVQDEQRYDRFHENADRIYRVVNERHADNSVSHRAATPPAMGPTLAREFPEVLQATRFFNMGKTLVERDGRQFFERHFWMADSTVFDIFSFHLVQGNPETALTAPYALVLSRTMARKYFGDEDPLGQTLTISGRNTFTVTGVMEDLPAQSHVAVHFLGSFATMKDFTSEERLRNWIWQQFYTYILLPDGYDPAQLAAKLPAFIAQYADPETSTRGFNYRTYLQPLTDVYLHSANLRFDFSPRGDVTYVYAFSIIALFILLIACFNFMNLATARSMQRAREVGMRKVIGAQRGQLIRQFLGESVLLALVGLVLAVGLVALVLPAFNTFTGKTLSLDLGRHLGLVAGLLGMGLLVGLIAGSYPAFFLSAFRPIEVLKGAAGAGGGGFSAVRKGLVVAQFAISTVLIIGAAVVFSQIDYVKNKKLGFDKEQVVVLPIRGDIDDNLETVKAELVRHAGIVSATASWGTPGGVVPGDDIRLPGSESTWPTVVFTVDHDYVRTYGMELAAGRDFSRDFPADTSEAFILNETAARDLGWPLDEAVGQEIWWDEWGRDDIRKGRVVGVVKDFHYNSLHQAIGPLVMLIHPSSFGHVSVRIRPEDVAATLDVLEQTWTTWAPDWPFEYYFLDEDLADEYEAEEKVGQLAGGFSLL
ncbi:MAG: ABC transporter permease, partial [Bacteroidetes bacterium]|nr:ABC transporter permease [Bacteroidota bacterium]